jgi:hypothetical protein
MKSKAKANLTKLIEKFERELATGKSKNYNEKIKTAKGSQKDQIQIS